MSKPRPRPLTVAIVTGTRAEFGLLRPVMHAVQKHKRLKLQVIAAGAHFLPPARTIKEVEAEFTIAARVPMQRPGHTGRAADALATARGVDGFARAYARLKPDWVVVLGDRIEAFAAASAASIAGIAVCHIHGGDRAEGIADEAMRHAITKLSHLHCAATKLSAERIIKMGEKPEHVHVTGSPAIDGVGAILRTSDDEFDDLGDYGAMLLLHPAGLSEDEEFVWATSAALIAMSIAGDRPVWWVEPNHDPGRDTIIRAINRLEWPNGLGKSAHIPRDLFIGLLKTLALRQGALIGNSSAGLIEAQPCGVPVIDLGPRQSGRERHSRVARVDDIEHVGPLSKWPGIVRRLSAKPIGRTYGDGRASPRIAALLARTDPHAPALLRKHNTY